MAAVQSGLNLIKNHEYDLLSHSHFLSRKRPCDECYLALAYASQSEGVCVPSDVKAVLDAFEIRLESKPAEEGAPTAISPLYFLAHARLESMKGNTYTSLALLKQFEGCLKDSDAWIAEDERRTNLSQAEIDEFLRERKEAGKGKASKKRRTSNPIPPKPEVKKELTIEEEWEDFAQKKGFDDEKKEPMDKVSIAIFSLLSLNPPLNLLFSPPLHNPPPHLSPPLSCRGVQLMKLTGLRKVKRIALNMFKSVEADKERFTEEGEDEGTTMESSSELNFAFVGNPGTGKTTVAKLFAKILEVAGVRSGNKFIKMTAAQALRKGSKKFATELSSLTGGDDSIGPPKDPLLKGMDVEVARLINRQASEDADENEEERGEGGNCVYGDPIPAKITNIQVEKDGSRIFTVLYTDNTEERVQQTLSLEERRKNALEKQKKEDKKKAKKQKKVAAKQKKADSKQKRKEWKLAMFKQSEADKYAHHMLRVDEAGRRQPPVTLPPFVKGTPPPDSEDEDSDDSDDSDESDNENSGGEVKVVEADIRAIGPDNPNIGGVLFLDEAHNLDPGSDSTGKSILADIMNAASEHVERVSIIMAGYKDDIEKKIFATDPGMLSRFKFVEFDDFDEAELREIFEDEVKRRKFKCGDDDQDVAMVAARKLYRQANLKGFGNARTCKKLAKDAVNEVRMRQASI